MNRELINKLHNKFDSMAHTIPEEKIEFRFAGELRPELTVFNRALRGAASSAPTYHAFINSSENG